MTPLKVFLMAAFLLFAISLLLFRNSRYDSGRWWSALGFRDLGFVALFVAGSYLF